MNIPDEPQRVSIDTRLYRLHAAAAELSIKYSDEFEVFDDALWLLCDYHWTWNGERVVFAPGTPVDSELSQAATDIYTAAARLGIK